jgi:hypothetical protein
MNQKLRERIYKYKKYPHFDARIHWRNVYSTVENPDSISKHAFYPFIHYTQTAYKYPKKYLAGKQENRDSPKERNIMYSSHIDRYIYEYYAYLVNEKYNVRVKTDGTNKCAIAYRNNMHRNNIHFAKDSFDTIKRIAHAHVIIGDFTGYFDNISHAYLKNMLCSLLGADRLPDDMYSVFRSITRYSYLDLDSIKEFKGMTRKEFYSLERVFSPDQFRSYKRTHIITNSNDYGIPQGSAISAVFSNVYLIDLDKSLNNYVSYLGGVYRRYCDDFIIVLPYSEENEFGKRLSTIFSEVQKVPGLKLETQKTQVYEYSEGNITNKAMCDNASANRINAISYLGFTFDGITIRIRSKTISKYYGRMYRKADTISQNHGRTKFGNKIPMSRIYRLYSRYGKDEKSNSGKFTAKMKKGNFLSYVDRAKRIFGERESIDRDTKRAWGKLQKRLHARKPKRDSNSPK